MGARSDMIGAELVAAIVERVGAEPRRYSDDAVCLDLLWRLRFSDDGAFAHCPRCDKDRRFHRIKARPAYSCDACGLHIHPAAGTPFHRTSTPLHIWFRAAALLSGDAHMRAIGLQHKLGMPYKTAWRLAGRLRPLLEDTPVPERPLGEADPAAVFAGERGTASFDERADAIVMAAARAIAKRGFGATRMSDIAREAGTSTATVHYYFRRREDVLLEALKRASLRPLHRLEQATTPDGDPREQIAKLLELAVPVGTLREEYVLWLELWNVVVQRPDLLPAVETLARTTRQPYLEIIRAGAAAGQFTLRAPVEEVAERIMAMVDALAFKCVVGYSWMPATHMRELLLRFAAAELGIAFEDLDANAAGSDGDAYRAHAAVGARRRR